MNQFCCAARVCAAVISSLAVFATTSASAAIPIKLSDTMAAGGSVILSGGYRFAEIATPRAVFLADRATPGMFELWSTPHLGGAPTRLSGSPVVDGGASSSWTVSPDGKWVAFRPITPAPNLWLAPTDGSAAPLLLSGTIISGGVVRSGVQWSADSQHIVFLADRLVANKVQLFRAGLNGGVPTQLDAVAITSGNVTSFEVSADSQRVVFIADATLNERFELYSVPIGGGAITVLSGTPPVDNARDVSSFAVSPDSSRVIFRGDLATDNVIELYSVAITSNAPVKISPTPIAGGNVNSFKFSPDGSRVVYQGDMEVNGTDALYSVLATGFGATTKISGTVPLFIVNANSTFQISPDSSRVVIMANDVVSGIAELYSVGVTSTSPVKISGTLAPGGFVFGAASSTQISADSARVVFLANKDSPILRELYSVGINGGATIKLSTAVSGGADATSIGRFALSANALSNASRVVFQAAGTSSSSLWSVGVASNVPVRISGNTVQATGTLGTGFVVSRIAPYPVVFDAKKISASPVELYGVPLDGGGIGLDIDGDGQVLASTDILLLMRWHMGIRGAALIANAVATSGATRTSIEQIEAYLSEMVELPTP